MSWEPSEQFDDWPGCRLCSHWRGGRCAAYPERIPLAIIAGQVDHMVVRPGQVGDTVFELMDLDTWYRTRRRVPAVSSAGSPA